MWNIRSHARRFPVHTGTLTPSIAHPNRFLNHLKRFSAGFLTFRGGKTEKRTLWGENSPVCCADSPLWDGALDMAGKFAGRPQSLRVRLLPLRGAVARSAAEGVIWVRTPGTDSRYGLQVRTPSVIAARCHLPHGGRHWQYTKASGQTAKPPVSPEPLPLGEVSPQVTERVPSREKVDRENPQIFPIYKL